MSHFGGPGTMRISIDFLFILVSSVFLFGHCNGQTPTVNIMQGKLNGRLTSGVSVFTAIPYGAPPTGNARFEKPQKAPDWPGTRDATQQGNICIQFTRNDMSENSPTQSEDCLNLDVYVPRDLSANATVQPALPVLVFVSGENFKIGSRADHNGTTLAKKGDMIVVIMNYRLGPLGFLALNGTPANLALLDQQLALQWVKENIESFGGDPNKVTIFGQGRISLSISILLLAESSKGLFHQAILSSSGLFDAYHNLTYTSAGLISISGNSLGCNVTSTSNILTCLRNLGTEILVDAFSGDIFGPVVDSQFLTDNPTNLMKAGKFLRVPILFGFNSEDGEALLRRYGTDIRNTGIPRYVIPQLLKDSLSFIRLGSSEEVRETASILAETYYFPDTSDPFVNLRSALDFLRDVHRASYAVKLARWFSEVGVPAYLYEFDEPLISNQQGSTAIAWGASDGEDLPYIFGTIEDKQQYPLDSTAEKLLLSSAMISAWSEFVHNGSPTFEKAEGYEVEWKPYTEDDPAYVLIKASAITSRLHPAKMADNVWNKVLDYVQDTPSCEKVQPSREGDPNPVVITEAGRIRGRHNMASGAVWETFSGVPYAAAPVGELRYRKPQPVKPWKGEFDATKLGPRCPQTYLFNYDPSTMSEDCLRLNIWVPRSTKEARESPLPAFVYLHGGGFVFGDNRLDWSGLAYHGNMTVFSIQYRLGVFSFLSTGDSTAPGNLALWDVIQALKWIKDNGGYFGADTNSITIAGHSAGAAIVSGLLLSPKGRGLFNGAITLSGNIFPTRIIEPDPIQRFNAFMKLVECDKPKAAEDKLDCARKVPWRKVLELTNGTEFGHARRPYIDGVLLPDLPQKLKDGSHIHKVNFLGGSLLHEGDWTRGQPTAGRPNDFINQLKNLYSNWAAVAPAVMQFYNLTGEEDDAAKYDAFVRDNSFVSGVELIAQAYADAGGSAFVYVANFSTQASPEGARHGDEVPLLAGRPLMQQNQHSMDQVLFTINFMKYLANFIHTGNPNDGDVPVQWPKYDASRPSIVISGAMDNQAEPILRGHRANYVDFNNKVFPRLTSAKMSTCISGSNIVQQDYSENTAGNTEAPCPTTGKARNPREDISLALMVTAGIILAQVLW